MSIARSQRPRRGSITIGESRRARSSAPTVFQARGEVGIVSGGAGGEEREDDQRDQEPHLCASVAREEPEREEVEDEQRTEHAEHRPRCGPCTLQRGEMTVREAVARDLE